MPKTKARPPKICAARVIFVTGPSGSGKSTLAAALARRLRYRLLSIDAIRQRHKGDSRKAWLEIWNVISHNQHAVIDATGASRIFRLVLRASAFRQAAPRVVRLTARDSVLRRRKKEHSGYGVFPVLLQANGKVSREYLADSVAFLPADLEIDTGKSGARETLTKTLRYLRGEQHNGRRT